MSRTRRDLHLTALNKMLQHADEDAFFTMLWSANAMQTGRENLAAKYFRFPKEAASQDATSRYAIPVWELETLANLILTKVAPKPTKSGHVRILDCTRFDTLTTTINHLREIEDAEAAIYMSRVGLLEMHRIAQRQFPWQMGFFNTPQFYKYLFIYGQGECAAYFEEQHGLPIDAFAFIGLALHTAFQERPSVVQQYSLREIGVSEDTQQRARQLLVSPLSVAQKGLPDLTKQTQPKSGATRPVAYRPSYFRRYPIIGIKDRLFAPLPALIAHRVTQGLYYDWIAGGGGLRNDASNRFELYCENLLGAVLKKLTIKRSNKYTDSRSKEIDSPDILIEDNSGIAAVIECKATKLTFGAQYSDDPISEAESGYREIAKGVVQIWRYISHLRRSTDSSAVTLRNVPGVILMLDTWLTMSRGLRERVFSIANDIADRLNADIAHADRCPVAFCSVSDMESLLRICSEDSFLSTLRAAQASEFRGWQLRDIHRSQFGTQAKNAYPFVLEDVFPAWRNFFERAKLHPHTSK